MSDLHLLYSELTQDIKFIKKQQWQVTYYAVMLMAPPTYFKSKCLLSICLYRGIIWGIGIVALALLLWMANDAHIKRIKLWHTGRQLSEEFQRILDIKPQAPKRPYYFIYAILLGATVIFAAWLLHSLAPHLVFLNEC